MCVRQSFGSKSTALNTARWLWNITSIHMCDCTLCKSSVHRSNGLFGADMRLAATAQTLTQYTQILPDISYAMAYTLLDYKHAHMCTHTNTQDLSHFRVTNPQLYTSNYAHIIIELIGMAASASNQNALIR